MAAAHVHTPPKDQPLTFGYLGTVNLSVSHMDALLAGWRAARTADDALAGARLEFRGHIGAGAAKSANAHTQKILRHAGVGVSYGGPVRKADVAGVYGSWDALVLALVGGRYVTSGKVYEYMATGLPIVSVHEPEHAAAEVLRDYPLWAPTASLEPDDIAKAFLEAARLATTADEATREAALACAGQFERSRQLEPAIREITGSFAKEKPES